MICPLGPHQRIVSIKKAGDTQGKWGERPPWLSRIAGPRVDELEFTGGVIKPEPENTGPET